MRKILAILTLTALLVACSNKNGADVDAEKMPIVTVNNQTLYRSDIKQIFKGVSSTDSARIADDYINLWISDILLYDKAQSNISEDEDIKALLREYRKSLIINKYQNQLLSEKLSKDPDNVEIRKFYDRNLDLFKLKEAIIKGLYLKIPVQASELPNLKKWYKQNTDEALKNIQSKTLQNTVGYENFHDTWVSFNDVLTNIPVNLNEHTKFLKNNKTLEVSDSIAFVYLLYISDYLTEGQQAPFEYIKDKVKTSYLEHQRDSFIKKLNQDLYKDAEEDGKITYHNKK